MARRVLKFLNVEPYNYKFMLALGQEDLVYVEKYNGAKLEENSDKNLGALYAVEDSNGTAFSIMYLSDEADEDTLWHEANHLVHFMMHEMGVPICLENTEIMAYTQEQIVNLCRKEIALRFKAKEKALEKVIADLLEAKKPKKKPKKKK